MKLKTCQFYGCRKIWIEKKTKRQKGNSNKISRETLYKNVLLNKITSNRKNYLNSYIMMKNADQKDMLHYQSCRHGNCSNTSIHENICQSLIHVLSAVGHVQLFYLSTNGGQIRFTQPVQKQNPMFTFSSLYMVPQFSIYLRNYLFFLEKLVWLKKIKR